jgi:hypothetical protein
MKLVVCCCCLCLVLAGVVAAAPASPVPVSSSFWESLVNYAGWIFKSPAPTGTPNATLNTFGLSYQCMIPGTYNIASIYLQNTGTMTWNETNQIRLGAVGESGSDAAKFGPLRVQIESGKDVLPGQTCEFQVPFTAPQTKGTYSPSYRMIWEGHNSFGDTATIPVQVTYPCPYPELSDVWTGWYIPAITPGIMNPGQTQEATIRVMNTGTRTWNESGRVRLGAVGDTTGDAAKFGVGRVLFPAGADVKGIVNNQAVEDQYAFRFMITAPQTPGIYKPMFRMIREPDQWFGPLLTVPIEVKAPPVPVPEYNSTIVSWAVPAIQSGKVAPGQQIDTAVTVMNTGSQSWNHRYQQPWSEGDVGLNSDVGRIDPLNMSGSGNAMFECMKNGFPGLIVYPGETCRVTFRMTAPASPGTYDMHFRMAHLKNGDNSYGFGDNLTIPLQVINASSVSRYEVPAGLDPARPGPGLNFQVSGSDQAIRTLPSGISSLQPVTEQVQPSPSGIPRELHVPVLPAAAIQAIPTGNGVTISASQSPQPVIARPVRTDVAMIKLFPVASFTVSPTTGTAPLSVACDASASAPGQGTLQSFAWNFGDGTTGSGRGVTHVFTRAGTYTITLVVTDSTSQTAMTIHQVNVSPPATVQVVPRINERPPVHVLQQTS